MIHRLLVTSRDVNAKDGYAYDKGHLNGDGCFSTEAFSRDGDLNQIQKIFGYFFNPHGSNTTTCPLMI